MDDVNACGCCQGISPQTPVEPVNRPGLSSIRRRVGNYQQFMESMLAALSSSRWPELRDLRTRQPDDFSIALLDCWAIVADVLTFYQERIANECYLGTATERRSLIELGRLTGYQLLPGAAATVWLAFTVEGAAGAPGYAKIPPGTRVQSVPGPEELPQIYETLDFMEARAEWNAMQPRQTAPQAANLSATHLVLQGAAGSLRSGDSILTVSSGQAVIKTIASIDRDRITLASGGLAATTVSAIGDGVWVLRSRVSIFGYNAPNFTTLPKETKETFAGTPSGTPTEWPFTEVTGDAAKTIPLDASYSQIVKGGIVVATIPGATPSVVVAQVTAVSELGVADFMLSGRVTQIVLDQSVKRSTLADVRSISLLAQSERLTLAPAEPDISNVDAGAKSIELDIALRQSPLPGSYAVLTGTPLGASVAVSELIQIVSFQNNTLTLKDGLQNSYQRPTVVINANVAVASHGETKTEVLGSGDGSRPYQTFLLSNSPVTYLADESPKGASSTLQFRVNKVLWRETPQLYGSGKRDRVYVTRIDDNYNMTVQTGDGRTGARLPTGVENVEAVYRVGLGLQGLVKAGQLKLLMTRPLGVKTVVNPLDAAGGADPERPEDARRNIPKQVLTLDRAVSLRDFEDYARAFTGISKALAVWFWSGLRRGVVLTIAGPHGLTVPATTISTLAKSLRQFGDRFVDLRIENYRPKVFQVKIELLIDPAYRRADVESAVSAAMSTAFSFDARQFGQPVSVSEVSALVQGVAGVVAARVPILDFEGLSPGPNTVLPAETPLAGSPDAASRDHAAELLSLAPGGVAYGVLS